MSTAHFRFYAELNDFIPPSRRQIRFDHLFNGRPSVKDMIESLGVPHTEVELILVNGEAVDFTHIVQDDDQVSVYPMFETFDATPVLRLRPAPMREPRFVLDQHLGKLATFLRLLGFDTLYRNDYGDADLARISGDEHRILLTRDRGLLKRSVVTHGYFVRQSEPRQQVIEVLNRFDLHRQVTPFRRCSRCNGLLRQVDKEQIIGRLPPHTQEYYDEFRICEQCGQIYWKGSHYQHLLDFIASVVH